LETGCAPLKQYCVPLYGASRRKQAYCAIEEFNTIELLKKRFAEFGRSEWFVSEEMEAAIFKTVGWDPPDEGE
jgi:hypothetical protein